MKIKRTKLFTISIIVLIILTIVLLVVLVPKLQNRKPSISFSTESGFYENEITLKLKASESNATIYYTTDGSTPTTNSEKYTKPFTIVDRTSEPNVLANYTDVTLLEEFVPTELMDKGTVVRAFAVFPDGEQTEVVTNTYFIGKELKEKYKDIMVLSLSVNPEDFFDEKDGIYVKGKCFNDWVASGGDPINTPAWEQVANFTQKGRDWERNVHMEVFENGKPTTLSQDLGIRIMGGASRSYIQKSFKLYARKEYGKGSIEYDLFPGSTKQCDRITHLSTFDTLQVRNGGNDSWLTKFRNRYIQLLVGDRAFTTQNSRPVIVFLNGEYWSIYTLQDDYSDKYVERNFDIPKENVVMIKLGAIEEGTSADQALYDDLISFAKNNDLSNDAKYEEICEMLDIQSFIDYYCTEIYIANNDWLNNNNNYRLWRSRTKTNKPYEDGKWRYMLYDTEFSMGIYTNGQDYNQNFLELAMTPPAEWESPQVRLFTSLLKNESFKQQFVTTFMDLLNQNFATEKMNLLLDEISAEYEPYMVDHYARFGNNHVSEPLSKPVNAFYYNLDELKYFVNHRNDYIPTMLKDTLKLEGDVVDINVTTSDKEGGIITINTITPDFSDGTFTGKYFSDYPITITAKANDGYTFKGFTRSDSVDVDKTITSITVALDNISSDEPLEIQAIFEKN